MYSKDTLKKYMRQVREIEADLLPKLHTLHVCISTGNKKIGRVMNVSMAAIATCHNCSECKHLCYDIKACFAYKGVLPARIRNTILAKFDRDRYFAEIDNRMARRRKNKFFRWHVSGDILDMDYFERMVNNARRHPDFVIWTYTKNYDVVNAYVAAHGGSIAAAIPANFTVMFSRWDGMPMPNPYNFPVFACRLADGNKDTTDAEFSRMHKCPGNCDICKATRRGCPFGESTYCDEH